jgi:phage protein D
METDDALRQRIVLAPEGFSVAGPELAYVKHAKDARSDSHQFSRQKRDDVPGVKATWHDRKAGKRKAFVAGKDDGAQSLSKVYASESEAQTAANAAHARAGREPVSLSLTLALGRPDIHPEAKARVSGYKAAIDAVAWLVAEVTHTCGDRGYTTDVKLEAA